MRLIGLLCLFALVVPEQLFGKAAYYGPEWMVREAEFIAVVTITTVQTNAVKGGNWTYSESATATVERMIKGKLPLNVTLHGAENFICAQVRYKPGRHLVFLRRDGNLLTGVNWHLGHRPIDGDQIEWFTAAQRSPFELSFQPIGKVITSIEEQIRRSGAAKPPISSSS